MKNDQRIDQLLRQSFADIPRPQAENGFDRSVMSSLKPEKSRRTRPVLIMIAYWCLAALIALIAIASVDWSVVNNMSLALLAIGGSLALLLVLPLLVMRMADVRISEIWWATVEVE